MSVLKHVQIFRFKIMKKSEMPEWDAGLREMVALGRLAGMFS